MHFEISPTTELRALVEADAEELFGVVEASRGYLAEWMPWASVQTLEGTRQFISSAIAQERAREGFQVAVVDEGRIAGVVGFHGLDRDNHSIRIGYWLAEDQQSKGLMSAAVLRLVDYAFDELAINRVELRAAPGNARSRALAERLGFQYEGTLREAECFGNEHRDLTNYSLLARERRQARRENADSRLASRT